MPSAYLIINPFTQVPLRLIRGINHSPILSSYQLNPSTALHSCIVAFNYDIYHDDYSRGWN